MPNKVGGNEDLLNAGGSEGHKLKGRIAVHLQLIKAFGMGKR